MASLEEIQQAFSAARRTASASGTTDPVAIEMARNRAANKKTAVGGSSISIATPRPTDPMFYWQNSNLPYDVFKPGELSKVRTFCRLLYLTHPTIGSVVDVYSTYPLVGMEMVCPKSDEIADFYNDLFMDQLNYEEFLIDVGKQYWTVGEAFPFASFNELLGTWEADELMLPEDVKVINSPFLREPRFEMRLPYPIRKIIIERKPDYEYRQLISQYPELVSYAHAAEWNTIGITEDPEDDDNPRGWIPVSNMVMSHVRHKTDTFHQRGIPLMMRAFRPLMQEEMLNSAQDAIASRLYTPLLLAKIGMSAQDLGTDQPWIPTMGDLDNFTEDINAALAADFRLITHHFAVSIENVFGRENMPDLNPDFDRLEGRTLQAFGMSKTMLSGASGGETYAADALNRDLLTQILSTFQKRIKRFVRSRAEVVAEAQGHYDFEMKGGRAVPIMEEIVETDPDTGNKRIVRQPKLLLPDLRIRSMNLADEQKLHDLLEQLRETGVPISMRTRLVNVPVDLADERDAVIQEQVDNAVAAAEAEQRTYRALRKKNLPIPQELKDKYEPRVITPGESEVGEEQIPGSDVLPSVGLMDPVSNAALAPTADDIDAAMEADPNADGKLQPRNRALMVMEPAHRPPESDEQRADMPKAASLIEADEGSMWDGTDMFTSPGELDDEVLGKIAMVTQEIPDGDSTRTIEVPLIGSYHTRHSGVRDVKLFFLATPDSDDPVPV